MIWNVWNNLNSHYARNAQMDVFVFFPLKCVLKQYVDL